MAFVVTRSQQVVTAGIKPRAVYSRVINLTVQVPAGLAQEDFAFTPAIGNRVWLLGVDLFVMTLEVDVVVSGFVYIRSGVGKPQSASEVATKWNPVIQNYGGPKPGFYFSAIQDHYHWNMNKFYEAGAVRFGVMATSLVDIVSWRAWVSFQISEG